MQQTELLHRNLWTDLTCRRSTSKSDEPSRRIIIDHPESHEPKGIRPELRQRPYLNLNRRSKCCLLINRPTSEEILLLFHNMQTQLASFLWARSNIIYIRKRNEVNPMIFFFTPMGIRNLFPPALVFLCSEDTDHQYCVPRLYNFFFFCFLHYSYIHRCIHRCWIICDFIIVFINNQGLQ